ncbi:hypothetical protein NMY22_g5942 [Coprinellus aureogranulatus]|nr:hypothetical protein NMY22_g5942 [Coprinellus aureogranulatus]
MSNGESSHLRRWNTDQLRVGLLDAEGLVSSASKVKGMWAGFVAFAMQENVLQVAVGVTIATAFTKLVKSLVSDILMPPISLLPCMDQPYNTKAQALADGALIWTYGSFLDELMSFMGIGLALYLIANVYGMFSKDPIIKSVVKCPYCKKAVSAKALRCATCTSWLDGREDAETSAIPIHSEL